MTASIHLFLSGNQSEITQSLPELPQLRFSRLKNIDPTHLRQEELVSLFEECDSEYVGIVDSQQFADLSQLSQLKDLNLCADQTEIYLLPFEDSESTIRSLESLTPAAASLVLNPLQHALVLFPKAAFLSLKDLPESADLTINLLWHALILMAQKNLKMRCVSLSPLTQTRPTELPLPVLAPTIPGPENDWLLNLLRGYQPDQDLPSVSSQVDATALKAGLLCIHDYLDESHNYSQSVQNQGLHQAGDYWHHIMHRREPDYSNAKYWSRVVGYHPIHDLLPERVRPLFDLYENPTTATWKDRLLQSNRWSLNTFVDCCEECESTQNPVLNELACRIQWVEMQLLLQKTSLDAATS